VSERCTDHVMDVAYVIKEGIFSGNVCRHKRTWRHDHDMATNHELMCHLRDADRISGPGRNTQLHTTDLYYSDETPARTMQTTRRPMLTIQPSFFFLILYEMHACMCGSKI